MHRTAYRIISMLLKNGVDRIRLRERLEVEMRMYFIDHDAAAEAVSDVMALVVMIETIMDTRPVRENGEGR